MIGHNAIVFPAATLHLTRREMAYLRLVIHAVSPFWKIVVEDVSPPNSADTTMGVLVSWDGEADDLVPVISLAATPCGFEVTTWDLEKILHLRHF